MYEMQTFQKTTTWRSRAIRGPPARLPLRPKKDSRIVRGGCPWCDDNGPPAMSVWFTRPLPSQSVWIYNPVRSWKREKRDSLRTQAQSGRFCLLLEISPSCGFTRLKMFGTPTPCLLACRQITESVLQPWNDNSTAKLSGHRDVVLVPKR